MYGRFWGKHSVKFSCFGKSKKANFEIKENGKGGLDFKIKVFKFGKFAKFGHEAAGCKGVLFDFGDPTLAGGMGIKGMGKGKFAAGKMKKCGQRNFEEEKASGDDTGFDAAVEIEEETTEEVAFTLEHENEALQIEDVLGMDIGVQVDGDAGEIEEIAAQVPAQSEQGAVPLSQTPLSDEAEAEVAAAEADAMAAEEPATQEPAADPSETETQEPMMEDPMSNEPMILEPLDPGVDPEFQDVADGELDQTSGTLLFLNENPGYFEDSGLTQEDETELFSNQGVALL